MADLTTLKRVAARLEETAGATASGAGFWPTLAQVAAAELESPPQIVQTALPAEPFMALARRQGARIITTGATLADLVGPVTVFLNEHGASAGDVWIVEVKRVYAVQAP